MYCIIPYCRYVILSAAKDLWQLHQSLWRTEILRCTQDDMTAGNMLSWCACYLDNGRGMG